MKLVILTPVWNDWEACRVLLERLDAIFAGNVLYQAQVLCVDDGSSLPMPAPFRSRRWRGLEGVKSLRLAGNFGHQKALAVGLGHLSQHLDGVDGVVLMDSDGEDAPEALPALLAEQSKSAAPVIVAARGRRREGPVFRFLHAGYKSLFRIATGKELPFGNFMFLRPEAVRALANSPHTGLHLAASVIKSRLETGMVTVDRGKRYAGSSRMSLFALFAHGMAAYRVIARGAGEPWVPARDYEYFLSRS